MAFHCRIEIQFEVFVENKFSGERGVLHRSLAWISMLLQKQLSFMHP